MPDHRSQALEYVKANKGRILEELREFLKIPSISTDPTYERDVQRAADWLADHLKRLGLDKVAIYPEPASHPVVYAESLRAGPEAPTVLIYGHYDVQPADPLDEWESDPFQPETRGDYLYARGSTDMKGQIMTALGAVEGLLSTGEPQINLKFIMEGEEEVGSAHLAGFISAHQDLLASDVSLNPDSGMILPSHPTITYALRGLAYFELRVYGPKQDLHSGLYGGVVHNPAQALTELVAGMHDDHGRVTLPGFYDRVRPLDEDEKDHLARLPMDATFYLDQTGVQALWGETDFAPVERIGARPTLEINGLYSGFTGAGAKTVLPAYAMAKISMRLVPDQDPEEAYQQLRAYLELHAPQTIRWELDRLASSPPSISRREGRPIKAMQAALKQVWGVEPIFRREGGSIPVVAYLQETLGVVSVLTGFSLLSDNMHAPNERLHIANWERGMHALVHFFFNLVE